MNTGGDGNPRKFDLGPGSLEGAIRAGVVDGDVHLGVSIGEDNSIDDERVELLARGGLNSCHCKGRKYLGEGSQVEPRQGLAE